MGFIDRLQYKAYGQLAGFADKPKVSNLLRLQGQYFDSETGLHYNRHRYYDPSVGRFIHQDPVGLLDGTNNYRYAPNPVGWVDPFGLTCKENISTANDQELINKAVVWQGPHNKGYPHKDIYTEVIQLQPGNAVYGLYPGQGEYYTTQATVDEFGHSAKAMNEALQIWPSDYGQAPGDYKYRPALAKYEVIKKTRAPIGPVCANTQWGNGGGTQLFIEDYEQSLQLVEVTDLPDNTPSMKTALYRASLDSTV